MRLELCSIRLLRRGDSDDGNYIYKEHRGFMLILNKTKVTRSKGSTRRKLKPTTVRLLNKYIKAMDIEAGDYLLTNRNGKPYSVQSYSRRIQRIFRENFGRNVGASLLRTIYLSSMYKNAPSLMEMTATAAAMGHNPSTALQHYVKKHNDITIS
jgi:integrase